MLLYEVKLLSASSLRIFFSHKLLVGNVILFQGKRFFKLFLYSSIFLNSNSRYCLAVICGQMNVDGRWFPLPRENLSSRKKHFCAIIKAKTVSEAVGHARYGLQEESQFSIPPTKYREKQDVTETVVNEKAVRSGTIFSQAEDNKENNSFSLPASKSVAPKR